ncbi:hypothetical protein GCM10009706_25270 [Curtobacterium citreum]|nr:hypothetical protein DEU32_10760 [Curtobacterium sp. AG1037]TQJ26553.1 hypothetical protein FB462_0392 [Curtobacterium citreum]GGL85603.1 hypothetical protein GCM10009706_25270 [Curtobacterium citreum]
MLVVGGDPAAYGGRVQDVRSPSLMRLLVTLAGLLVLAGALVIGVLATVGTAAQHALGPSRTADGSTCSPLSGECSQLSRSAVEQMVGITLPAGTRLVSSGSRDMFKASESWAVACVPEAQRVFDAAEADGFVPRTPSDYPERRDWSDKQPTDLEVHRAAELGADQWLQLGGACSGGSYVYLGHFLDK